MLLRKCPCHPVCNLCHRLEYKPCTMTYVGGHEPYIRTVQLHINSLYCNLWHCHLTLADCEVQCVGIGGTGDEFSSGPCSPTYSTYVLKSTGHAASKCERKSFFEPLCTILFPNWRDVWHCPFIHLSANQSQSWHTMHSPKTKIRVRSF